MKNILFILLFISGNVICQVQPGFQIARLKYGGGGDWYNDPSAEVNLLKFVNENTNIKVNPEYKFVDISTSDLFAYPFLFITGHGNFVLSDAEAVKLRDYIKLGGFIYIDDDYGLDKSVKLGLKKIFPENDLVELPFNHEIYHNVFQFNYGPPKIHEHDNKPPQGFGVFVNNRLSIFYTYESNPSDGWADANVHNNPEQVRRKALQFGTNLIVWVLTN